MFYIVRTDTGLVYCLYLKHMTKELALSASLTIWSMIKDHDQLGHPNIDATREVVRGLRLNVEQAGINIC